MAQYYALHDYDEKLKEKGCFPISDDQANKLNKQGYGIFWTFNTFKDGIRRISELIKINAWAIDMDDISIEKQLELINKAPLQPSMAIHSKRGFHLYWFAKDACKENYCAITESRLVPFFKADPRAKDIARILRVPGYYHCKDPNDFYMVTKEMCDKSLIYSEKEMLMFFPAFEKKVKVYKKPDKLIGDNIWEKIHNIPCEYALNRLSGHWLCKGEKFDFKNCTNGTKTIIIDGRATSNWIDCDGMIGVLDGSGSSIATWAKWYGNSWKTILEEFKKIFPEVENE